MCSAHLPSFGRATQAVVDGTQPNSLDGDAHAFLYSREELIALMLLGRGDFEHSYASAVETCSKYVDPDDQVLYLMGKTVRLAEYLRIGLDSIARMP